MNKSLFKKFLEFGLGNIVALALGLISSPIITRIIEPNEFGKFSMFNTVTSLLLFVLTAGLDQAYVRFFYEEDEEGRRKLLKKSLKIPAIINIVIAVIVILLYKEVSKFIIGNYSFWIIIMIIMHNTFNILSRFSLMVIRMQQKGNIYSLLQIISKMAYIVLTLALAKFFQNDYRTLVFAIVISNVIVVISGIFIERKHWFRSTKEIIINTTTKEMLFFGVPLIFSMAITWVFNSIDKVFIGMFNGYTELGLYSSAFSIVALLNAVQNSFTIFWVPVANENYKKNPNDTGFYTRVNSIICLIMIILAIALITFKDLLILLLGSKYRDASFIFPFLVFMPIMYTISETTVLGISFMKKTQYHIIIAIISAIVNLAGNFLLVPSMGAKGAAISTGISYMVFFLARTIISRRLYEVNYNLIKFIICIIPLTILALYASFYSLDIILVILGIITLITTLILYRNTLKELLNLINVKKLIRR